MRQRLDALSLAALTGLAITASSWLLDTKEHDPMPSKIKDQITATIARNLHEEPSKIADKVLALSHVETPSEPGRYERIVTWGTGDPSDDTVEGTFTLEMRKQDQAPVTIKDERHFIADDGDVRCRKCSYVDTVVAKYCRECFRVVSKKPEPWYVDEDQGIAVPMRMVEHEGRRYRRVGE